MPQKGVDCLAPVRIRWCGESLSLSTKTVLSLLPLRLYALLPNSKETSETTKDDKKKSSKVKGAETTKATEQAEKPEATTEESPTEGTVAVAAMAVAAATTTEDVSPQPQTKTEDDEQTEKAGKAKKGDDEETKDEVNVEKAAQEKNAAEMVALPTMAMMASLTEESPYPYPVNMGKDVISGKGGKVSLIYKIRFKRPLCLFSSNFVHVVRCLHTQVQQYNRHFRNLVAEAYASYDATTSKIAKRRIGVAIYNNVIERGGRFLDSQGKEMDRPKAVLKVMKALKDAKTWTSDAKRAAKERREAKQKEGADKTGKDTAAAAPATAPAPNTTTTTTTNGNGADQKEGNGKEAKATEKPAAVAANKETSETKAADPAMPVPFKEEEEKGKEEKRKDEAEKESPLEPKEDPKETKPDTKETKKDKPDKKQPKQPEKEAPPAANTRKTRSSSKRRLPLNEGPPTTRKSARKGSGEEVVDSTNDAVRGLHLLSQATHAVAKDKKSVQTVTQV